MTVLSQAVRYKKDIYIRRGFCLRDNTAYRPSPLWMRQLSSCHRGRARARPPSPCSPISCSPMWMNLVQVLLACSKQQLRPGRVACPRSRTYSEIPSPVRPPSSSSPNITVAHIVIESSSHLLLHPSEFHPNRFHRYRRTARLSSAVRRCLLPYVGIRDWLVLAPLPSRQSDPTCLPFFFLPRTGWCVVLGGSTALDTLGSQAFTGGKHSTDLSIHFQRCVIMLCLLFVPIGIAWANMAPILIALGQEEELSRNTQQFLRVLILAAPGYIGFESLKKYLQCQGMIQANFAIL